MFRKLVALLMIACYVLMQPQSCRASDWEEDAPQGGTSLPADDPLLRAIQSLTAQQVVAIFEINLLGKANPEATEFERLSKLETAVFGSASDSPDLTERMNALFKKAPPSGELVVFVAEAVQKDPRWSGKLPKMPWLKTDNQRLSVLEHSFFAKVEEQQRKNFLERLEALETQIITPAQISANADLPIAIRIDGLMEKVQPAPELISKVVEKKGPKGDWFWHPKPVPWLDNLGRGVAQSAKETGGGVRSLLSSPEFWEVMLLTGAAVGAGFAISAASKKGGSFPMFGGGGAPVGTSSSYGSIEKVHGHRCTGSPGCRVCETCTDCQHCAKMRADPPCGVYVEVNGTSFYP